MKTPHPRDMLQDLVTEVIENTSLLEVIFRNYEMEPEADNAIQCLIRSQLKAIDKANEFIGMLSDVSAPPQQGKSSGDIEDDVFSAVLTARKLEEVANVYGEYYFTDKDNDNPMRHMSAVIFDYAHELCNELKAIQSKLD